MKSIIYRLKTEEFPRIRVGTGGQEEKENLIDYVIGKVLPEEYTELLDGINKGADAVCEILRNGIDKAMNKFN